MADVKLVNLYYLGGFVAENPRVSSRGTSYAVPPAGEYIQVPEYTARDLIRRNRTPQGVSVFTTDPRVAQMVKERRTSVPTLGAEEPKFTREQLLEMLNELDDVEDAPGKATKPTTKEK